MHIQTAGIAGVALRVGGSAEACARPPPCVRDGARLLSPLV